MAMSKTYLFPQSYMEARVGRIVFNPNPADRLKVRPSSFQGGPVKVSHSSIMEPDEAKGYYIKKIVKEVLREVLKEKESMKRCAWCNKEVEEGEGFPHGDEVICGDAICVREFMNSRGLEPSPIATSDDCGGLKEKE